MRGEEGVAFGHGTRHGLYGSALDRHRAIAGETGLAHEMDIISGAGDSIRGVKVFCANGASQTVRGALGGLDGAEHGIVARPSEVCKEVRL